MAQIRIGQMAREAGVGVDTIRYYERRGLLTPASRRSSGYRQFDPAAVKRVRFIKSAQELGFTLGEIRELLDLRVHTGATCADVRAKARTKILEVQVKIRLLEKMRESLERISAECSGAGPASECPILDFLDR